MESEFIHCVYDCNVAYHATKFRLYALLLVNRHENLQAVSTIIFCTIQGSCLIFYSSIFQRNIANAVTLKFSGKPPHKKATKLSQYSK